MKDKKQLLTAIKNTSVLCVVSLLLGAVIGALDALFGRVLLAITDFRGIHPFWLIPFLGPAGVLIVVTYKKWGQGTEKGMGLIFSAGHGETDEIPLRLVPFVMISTWLTHLFGGSAGREGVAVQMGGTVSYWVGKKLPIKDAAKILLIVGMAAGFAGLFRTPLAAVCFALEVLVAGAIEYRALLPAVFACYSASTVSGLCGLEKFTFAVSDFCNLDKFTVSVTNQELFTLPFAVRLIILGVVFGVTGGAFAGLLKWMKNVMAKAFSNPIIRILVVGVGLSIIFMLLSKGRYSGLGTNLINAGLQNNEIYPWDWAIKFILTILTLAAGFQGGEVTPLFSIGAGLGAVLGALLGLPVPLAAALGYAAVFGGASNTFFAPMLIGAEVFGFEYLPLFFIVCAIAYVCNMNFSIYGGQKQLSSYN